MSNTVDKIKEKVQDAKDSFVDKTKDFEEKAKETVDTSSTETQERVYQEGGAGANVHRNSDPLTQYSDREPMTPAKITEHEPTAVKRDPNDQKIAPEGQTGTESESAQEQYRKRGMTKVDSNSTEHSHGHSSSCGCGH